MAGSLDERLIKSLINNKVISQDKLDAALEVQKKKGGKLSDILINGNYVDKERLAAILGQELDAPPIKLSRYKIDPEVLKLLPRKLAEQHRVIPISKMGDVITIAMADPLNILAIDDIKDRTGCKVSTLITTDKDIENAISEYYDPSAKETFNELLDKLDDGEKIQTIGMEDEKFDTGALAKVVEGAPVVKITNILLSEAVRLRASDVLIEPQEKDLRVRYRIDGMLQTIQSPPKNLQNAIISRLKVISGLNIAERRLPQDGRFMARMFNKDVDFRVSIVPSSFGEKAALRILDKTTAMLDVERLGFEAKGLEGLKAAAEKPHGMLLACGPTGCGKTTTLYSILKYLDTPEKNIVTVEDPVEYQLSGINQVTVNPAVELTFASALRSILRQDPDIIMVGEIRDFDTVDIAIKAALTGHLVLSTIHTTTACGSVVRLLNMGVEPFLISSSVILVAAQRLVRRICDDCKESYQLDDTTAESFGIDPKKNKLYRGKGCKVCMNTGYKGRIGLLEVLTLTPKIKDLVASNAQEFQIKEAARKEGMKTLREHGIEKALKGITTVEEIMRVTVGDQDIVTE